MDRGVNRGKPRPENTRLISTKPMHYCSIDGFEEPSQASIQSPFLKYEELNAGELPFGTFGAVILTNDGSAVIIKQEEKTINLPAELEDYSCFVSNALTKMDWNQDNLKLYGFAVPVCHKIGLVKVPMDLLIDQEWKELSHVIPYRDRPCDAPKGVRVEPREQRKAVEWVGGHRKNT
jgi:hypothetical protein